MRKKGFTLVEILIVVVILGILAAIVIPQFTDASTEAKVSSLVSNLHAVRSQIQLYKIREDAWPSAVSDLVDNNYMMTIPNNPFTDGNTCSAAGGGGDWIYDSSDGSFSSGDADHGDL